MEQASVTAAESGTDFLRVGDHELAYTRTGRGPNLLFIHGWPLHSATFRHLTPLLSRDYTCHLIDLPGAGRTRSAPGAGVSIRDHVNVLRATADALGLSRYALIAHDSGGLSARHLAATDTRVAALVLGDTELPGLQPASITTLCGLSKLPGGAQLFRKVMGSPKRRAAGFGSTLEDQALFAGEFSRLFVDPLFATVEASRRALGMFPGYLAMCRELPEVHARITAPTLLIWGEADTFFPLRGAREMQPQFKGGAQLETIPGGRLFVHEDHPDTFAELARQFLARCFMPS
jgi:haloalkane dehalogenase